MDPGVSYYMRLYRKAIASEWIPIRAVRRILDVSHSSLWDLQYGPDGILHSLWEDVRIDDESYFTWMTYRTSIFADTTQTSTAAQTITIPEDMHSPTLAFMHQVYGGVTNAQTHFAVSITDGITTTDVFSTSQNGPWLHAWADLSAWAGETVTVTFELRQAAGEPLMTVALDEVSVGPWLTPVIENVTPAQVRAGAATIIRILADNLIETPTVRLGDVALTNVRLIDSQTLEATVPSSVKPGSYNLSVTNQDGVPAVWAAVLVGERTYLPLANKDGW